MSYGTKRTHAPTIGYIIHADGYGVLTVCEGNSKKDCTLLLRPVATVFKTSRDAKAVIRKASNADVWTKGLKIMRIAPLAQEAAR